MSRWLCWALHNVPPNRYPLFWGSAVLCFLCWWWECSPECPEDCVASGSPPAWTRAAHVAGKQLWDTRRVWDVMGGDEGSLFHWTKKPQILALAALEVQFLRVVAWFAWLSCALQPGVTVPLLSFLSCSWISRLGSDSAHSHLELVFFRTRVSLTWEKYSPGFGYR